MKFDDARVAPKTRKLSLLFVLCLLGTVAGYYVWSARRPLSSRAVTALDVMLAGDAKRLMTFASSRELKDEGITTEKLQQVLDRLIRPYIVEVDHTHAPETGDDTGDFHAMGGRLVRLNDGREVGLSFSIWHGDEGDFASVLHNVLIISWQMRFLDSVDEHKKFRLTHACLKGVRADRDLLRSVGLPGATPEYEDKPFHDWDGMEKRCEEIIADSDARAKDGTRS